MTKKIILGIMVFFISSADSFARECRVNKVSAKEEANLYLKSYQLEQDDLGIKELYLASLKLISVSDECEYYFRTDTDWIWFEVYVDGNTNQVDELKSGEEAETF